MSNSLTALCMRLVHAMSRSRVAWSAAGAVLASHRQQPTFSSTQPRHLYMHHRRPQLQTDCDAFHAMLESKGVSSDRPVVVSLVCMRDGQTGARFIRELSY